MEGGDRWANESSASAWWVAAVCDLDEPRTQRVTMEAEDDVWSLYEMACGCSGVFHAARFFHPMPRGASGGGLEIYGTEGNLVCGRGPWTATDGSASRSAAP